MSTISTCDRFDIERCGMGANRGGASRGTEGGMDVRRIEEEVDPDFLSDAHSRTGLAESGDSCESKRKSRCSEEENWMNTPITFPLVLADDVSDEPLKIEAEVEGYLVRRVFVDHGAAVQVMFEHCFDNLPSSIKARLTPTQTELVGFSEEQLIPIGKVELEVAFGSEGLCRRIMMKFMVVRVSRTTFVFEYRRLEKKQVEQEGKAEEVEPERHKESAKEEAQLVRNLEAYVDEMVIKGKTERDMVMDIAKTFDNLQKINMKLNPKKGSFSVIEGKFLGIVKNCKIPCSFKNLNTQQTPSSNTISFYHRSIKQVIFNHTNFSMTTLADKAILLGAENHTPMLEKDMYDSWKSRMELYMMSRQHARMILESVENGPLIWPSIEENRVTGPKKYSELSATEAIQSDCDVKATNIILQGLPPEVYALVSNHKVAKELWERIQHLMQGTSLTKQERE
nr:reverse transcriptase domain-containing protein [Tanacetum cinerariifolium]